MNLILGIILGPINLCVQLFSGGLWYQGKVFIWTEEILKKYLAAQTAQFAVAEFKAFLRDYVYIGDEIGVKAEIRYSHRTKTPIPLAVCTLAATLREARDTHGKKPYSEALERLVPLLDIAVSEMKKDINQGTFSLS